MNPVSYLLFRLRMTPKAIAILSPTQSITYEQLYKFVLQLSYRFREMGLKKGQAILFEISDQGLEWALILASFHEGLTSCTGIRGGKLPENLIFDYLITDIELSNKDVVYAKKNIVLNENWFKSLGNMVDWAPVDYQVLNLPCRFSLTSGTTGVKKAIPITAEIWIKRATYIESIYAVYGRGLSMLGLSTTTGFMAALTGLINGKPFVVFRNIQDIINFINKGQVDSLLSTPALLRRVVEKIEKNKIPIKPLRAVRSFGSVIPIQLAEKVGQILSPNLINHFGSTETGSTCSFVMTPQNLREGSYAGYPLPGVKVQIVNEKDESLELGSEGIVRISTPYMANEYHNNPEATEISFKHGWFYPGDRGVVGHDGMLSLSGRISETINRGGVKINPALIDREALMIKGVVDAATFSIPDKYGLPILCMAWKLTYEADEENIKVQLRGAVGEAKTPTFFVRADEIPRNETGKPLRSELTNQYVDILRKKINV